MALIREGLTNEQIAIRLGISESGARFHVSGILSKLGVSSREEAKAWQPETRRKWSMLSPLSTLSGLREAVPAILTAKATGALLLPVVVLALAAGGYGVRKASDGGAGRSLGGGQQAKAAVDPCAALFTRQCFSEEAQNFTTIEEATAVASFEPALPTYIPDGFTPVAVRHTRPEGTAAFTRSEAFKQGCPGCDPRLSHNDQIGIYYRNTNGQQLAVVQGFPAYFPLHQSAPEDRRGTVRIGDREAFWVQGLPGRWDERQIALYLEVGRVGSGWARLPDGTVLTGSPMSYSITSNGLPLEELIKIAESASFD